jgi:AraC-like DNA-binding protein
MRERAMPGQMVTELLYQNPQPHPLGRISMAGTIRHSGGTDPRTMRVLGSYALVYVVAGGGTFIDAAGYHQSIAAGDLMLVFPEIAHHYGPAPGGGWDEIYIVFDGPVFDLWRQAELLDPKTPVWSVPAVEFTLQRLRAVVGPAAGGEPPDPLELVTRLQAFLSELIVQRRQPAESHQTWLRRARALLEPTSAGVGDPAAAAAALGMPYERFRKRFRQLAGAAPKQYADQRVIAKACGLLYRRPMTNRALARACGFCDEFHFARRFRQIMGIWPSEFRRTLPGGRSHV